MGNIATGAFMVFFVIVLNAVVAFVVDGATPNAGAVGCETSGGVTTCEDGGLLSFFATFLEVAVTGFSGIAVVDAFYVLILAGILLIGVTLIAAEVAMIVATAVP